MQLQDVAKCCLAMESDGYLIFFFFLIVVFFIIKTKFKYVLHPTLNFNWEKNFKLYLYTLSIY